MEKSEGEKRRLHPSNDACASTPTTPVAALLAQLIDNASSIDSPIEIAVVFGGNANFIAVAPSRVPIVTASRTSSRS